MTLARDIFKTRARSFLNKDFEGFKRDLISFSDSFASGVLSDKSTPSSTMALIELMSFIGDTLSFNIDQAFNELREDTAVQIENVTQFAKMRGYKVRGKVPARGVLPVMIEVPATTTTDGSVTPDPLYLPVLSKGSRAQARNGTSFETLEDIDFSVETGRAITGSLFGANGLPTHFAIRKSVDIIAGQTKTESFTVSSFRAFRSIEISDQDVSEVISVTDSDGNEWVEVDYLAQDWVFAGSTNTGNDSSDVPYTLKVVSAPRRFITGWDPITKKTSLTFGSGDGASFDDELIPNVADYAIPLAGKRTSSGFSIDPRNFLKTRTLGLSPYNTTLTVTYRVGGGSEGNVDPGSIDTMSKADLSFVYNSLDPLKKADVEGSVQCYNSEKTDGGMPQETIREIKMNSAAFFAAQDRCVTRADIIARILSIPAKYGKPSKVFVKTDDHSSNSIDVYVLAEDTAGHLTAPSVTLKRNIATYVNQYRMLTDGFNIFDGAVINMRCNFGVVVAPKFNKSETLSRCIDALTTYFSTTNTQIGKPLVKSEVIATLHDIEGVLSVYELGFSNVFGLTDGLRYSSARFDFQESTRNGIIYCPDDSVFELKYPRRDIVGVAR